MKTLLLNQKTAIIAGAVLLVILAAAPSLYFYSQYQKAQRRLQDPTTAAREERQELINRVGKLIELPTDEEPTVATISDRERLADQPFFARAKNGDKLLIYPNAKKAILYDPFANRIVDVSAINIGTPSATITTTLRLALYNGTETTGVTRQAEQDLKAKMENLEVIVKDNAKKKDYDKTLVIDLVGNKRDQAQEVARLLKGEIGNLPAGEERPTATVSGQIIDILVIIGRNYSQ